MFLCGMCPIEQMKPSAITQRASSFGGFDTGALDFGISHVRSVPHCDTLYGTYSWPLNDQCSPFPGLWACVLFVT